MPRVSVIVPIRNEANHIRRTLEGLQRQSFPIADFEVIVVDGGSTDETPAIVRQCQKTMSNLHLHFNPKKWSSAARNIGVRHSRGDYMIIVDGHSVINDRYYLSKMVEAFELSGADCLGRPQPLRSENPAVFQAAVGAARMSWLGHNPDSSIFENESGYVDADNVAVAYRRSVFEKIGLFDESFDACEDVEFNTRVRMAGMSCYFTPAISVDYEPRSSLRSLMYQMNRYGRGRARLAKKFPVTVTLPSLVPPLWVVWIIGCSIASFFSHPIAIAGLTSLLCYLGLIATESIRVGRGHSLKMGYRLPIVFWGIHFGFAWGYLSELFSTRAFAINAAAVLPRIPVSSQPVAARFQAIQPISTENMEFEEAVAIQ